MVALPFVIKAYSPIDHCCEVLSRSLATDPTDSSITTDTFRSEVKKLSLLDAQDNMTPNYPIFTNCTIQCEYCFEWKCCFETPKLSKPLSQKENVFLFLFPMIRITNLITEAVL